MCNLPQPDRCPPPGLPSSCLPAWRDAVIAHDGQKRSFDNAPYITHPQTVAETLATWGWSATVVSIGLLHDSMEDCEWMSPQLLAERHGHDVAQSVAVLSKDKSLPKADQGPEAKCRLALALPKLGPAIGIVKLIDRAHNMVTATHLHREKQAELVSDARYFFSPLARQLGLSKLSAWFQSCCPVQHGLQRDEFTTLMQSFSDEGNPCAVQQTWNDNTYLWKGVSSVYLESATKNPGRPPERRVNSSILAVNNCVDSLLSQH